MKIRFYYTLDELLSEEPALVGFNKLFYRYLGNYSDTQETSKLFDDINLKFGDENILYIDYFTCDYCTLKPTIAEILLQPELRKQLLAQIRKIKAWLEDSKFRFETLIHLYESNSDNLLKQIESINTVKFNDTPQTITDGLDTDEYASTYTVNRAGTDAATLIARLSEIRANWTSLYEEWAAEFSKKFVLY